MIRTANSRENSLEGVKKFYYWRKNLMVVSFDKTCGMLQSGVATDRNFIMRFEISNSTLTQVQKTSWDGIEENISSKDLQDLFEKLWSYYVYLRYDGRVYTRADSYEEDNMVETAIILEDKIEETTEAVENIA